MKSWVLVSVAVLSASSCSTPTAPSHVDIQRETVAVQYRVVDDAGGGGGQCGPICPLIADVLIVAANGDTLIGRCGTAAPFTGFDCLGNATGAVLTGGTGRFTNATGIAKFTDLQTGAATTMLNFAAPALFDRRFLINGVLSVAQTLIRPCSQGQSTIILTGQLEQLGNTTVTFSFCVP